MSSDDMPDLPEFNSNVDEDAVVATVFELHEAMDLFKEWAALTTLRIEREVDDADSAEEAADLRALIDWVETVRLRLVLSEEESLENSPFNERDE